MISVGLFADGKSNYGGSWSGVNGNVTGLFYGDAGQLVAQLIGVATLIGFVFTFSFVVNWIIDVVGRPASRRQGRTGRSGSAGNGRALLSRVRGEGQLLWSGGSAKMSTALQTDQIEPSSGCSTVRSIFCRFPGETLTRSRPRNSGVYRFPREGLRRESRAPPTYAPASAWRTP